MEQLNIDIFQDKNEAVCRLYWELETEERFKYKVSEIANMMGIKPIQISSLMKESCVVYSNTVYCIECEQPYELSNRTDYSSHHRYRNAWKCAACIQDEQDNILNIRQKQIDDLIERTQTGSIDISDLSLKQCAYLLALIRHSSDEMLVKFHAISKNKAEQLMPHPNLPGDLIRFLYKSDVISLSDDSPQNAFHFTGDELTTFSLIDSVWQIELEEGVSLGYFLKQIENLLLDSEFIDAYKEDFYELLIEISLMECIAFLEYNLDEHNLPFNPGEKTKAIFIQLLGVYSVAQIYTFIWRACKDAAAYYMKGGISKQQAANSVVGNIQRQYERAIANDWNIGPFKRNYNLPQSILSQVVFNFMLRTDDGGFNQKISTFITK
ncbi:hypothetical protein B9T10_07305 [Wohlfahrtiimonas chitiniclastica]|uniref:hypothetical protein n=1 Tax=Wohlfahrtiimonas chitiniclastica TaxID=400946 RepID=UPI000B998187|nr:hypothetical protein [Wohlfahrtiimonas chitiniclastica]OYQ89096.1 hypothetical protein B9T10_07305 [Wohlfahrtiimonas chitiniclastica]